MVGSDTNGTRWRWLWRAIWVLTALTTLASLFLVVQTATSNDLAGTLRQVRCENRALFDRQRIVEQALEEAARAAAVGDNAGLIAFADEVAGLPAPGVYIARRCGQ